MHEELKRRVQIAKQGRAGNQSDEDMAQWFLATHGDALLAAVEYSLMVAEPRNYSAFECHRIAMEWSRHFRTAKEGV